VGALRSAILSLVPAVRRTRPNRPVYPGLGSAAESDIGDLSRARRDSLWLEQAWVLGVYPTCETCAALTAAQSQRQSHETAPAARFAERGRYRARATPWALPPCASPPSSALSPRLGRLGTRSLLSISPAARRAPCAAWSGASRNGIMSPGEGLVVGAFESVVTARVKRGNHRLA
jgi:hypothetical protein